MLNPRTHPLHQESDRLQVGECLIDLPRRELTSPGQQEPTRLSVKSLQVLLALVGHQGKVVSREALLNWVWPDTLPTDDVLTQAIGQLRKAFGDDREQPRYLETISKGGYRLLAQAQWLDNPGLHAQAVAERAPPSSLIQADPGENPPARHSVALLSAVVAVIAAIIVSLWWVGNKNDGAARTATAPAEAGADSQALAFTTITSRPGREASPNVSPDGAMVAYQQIDAAGIGSIMLQTTQHVPAQRLTRPPVGHSDSLPGWSHDGRRIAFVRYDPTNNCQIMVIAASGGSEQKIADCFAGGASPFDWTPDDTGLLMGLRIKPADQPSSPLRLLDIASGQWRALEYEISPGDVDTEPMYSPDGKWIAFRRNLSLADLWKMPAGGGTPQRLTHIKSDIHGWDWLPDGSGLVLSYAGYDFGMFRYDMATGSIKHLRMDDMGVTPDIARNSPVMAFVVDKSTSGIFRFSLPADPAAPVEKQRVFASSRSDMLPSLSPDGRSLAFISDRGARLELWLGKVDQPDNATPVQGLMPVPRHAPVWSQDGKHLLVIGNQTGQQALYEVEVASGRIEALPVPASTPLYAAYGQDPNRIYVGSDSGDGRLHATLYDRSARPWRVLATLDGAALLKYDARKHKVYFTRMTRPGIWSATPQLQDVQVLDAERPALPMEYKRWDIGRDGVYFLEWSETCAVGWVRMGTPKSQATHCLDRQHEAMALAPSLQPDGRALYLSMGVSDNADIGLADVSGLMASSKATATTSP